MHEFSLAHSILEITLETAEANNATSVSEVQCTIGALRQVVPSLMDTAFEACCAGTMAEGAKLVITVEPVKVSCSKCNAVSEMQEMVYQCPKCESVEISMSGGTDMIITSLTIDQENGHED